MDTALFSRLSIVPLRSYTFQKLRSFIVRPEETLKGTILGVKDNKD
jgi:hypothetical protein